MTKHDQKPYGTALSQVRDLLQKARTEQLLRLMRDIEAAHPSELPEQGTA